MSSAGPVLGVRGSLFQEFQIAFWRAFKTLLEIRGKASPGPLNWAPRGPLVPIQNYIAPVGRPADWFCALFALCLEVLPQSHIIILPCIPVCLFHLWSCVVLAKTLLGSCDLSACVVHLSLFMFALVPTCFLFLGVFCCFGGIFSYLTC